jgi:hypothetical protein
MQSRFGAAGERHARSCWSSFWKEIRVPPLAPVRSREHSAGRLLGEADPAAGKHAVERRLAWLNDSDDVGLSMSRRDASGRHRSDGKQRSAVSAGAVARRAKMSPASH